MHNKTLKSGRCFHNLFGLVGVVEVRRRFNELNIFQGSFLGYEKLSVQTTVLNFLPQHPVTIVHSATRRQLS